MPWQRKVALTLTLTLALALALIVTLFGGSERTESEAASRLESIRMGSRAAQGAP